MAKCWVVRSEDEEEARRSTVLSVWYDSKESFFHSISSVASDVQSGDAASSVLDVKRVNFDGKFNLGRGFSKRRRFLANSKNEVPFV